MRHAFVSRVFLFGLRLLLGCLAFVYWWENALTSIPLSERVWTLFFHLTGQTGPALPSDLEFIVAIVIGLLLTLCIEWFFKRWRRGRRIHRRNRPEDRQSARPATLGGLTHASEKRVRRTFTASPSCAARLLRLPSECLSARIPSSPLSIHGCRHMSLRGT